MRNILKSRGIENTNFLAESSTKTPDFVIPSAILSFLLIFSIAIILFSIVWHLTFVFTIPLIADKDIGVMEAISLSARAGWSNIGGLILLMILQTLVGFVGALACGIGIFFVLPIIYASNAVAYRQVFPDTPQPQHNAPPQPNAYGGSYGQPM